MVTIRIDIDQESFNEGLGHEQLSRILFRMANTISTGGISAPRNDSGHVIGSLEISG